MMMTLMHYVQLYKDLLKAHLSFYLSWYLILNYRELWEYLFII